MLFLSSTAQPSAALFLRSLGGKTGGMFLRNALRGPSTVLESLPVLKLRYLIALSEWRAMIGVNFDVWKKFQEEDQGAYSCEAINSRGTDFAVPDANLICKHRPGTDVCFPGTFNVEATRQEECISCFCFGKTSSCQSADLFTYQIPPPFNQYRIIGVNISRDRGVEIRPDATLRTSVSSLRPVNNGFQVK